MLIVYTVTRTLFTMASLNVVFDRLTNKIRANLSEGSDMYVCPYFELMLGAL
jgi:hypothetical protein